jgi:ATP-dependent DNA helicase RecG
MTKPMDIDQLKALVKQGESHSLEFKTSTTQLKGAFETLCGFLNGNNGGTVLIGVTDKGKVVGQQVTDKTKQEIAAEIKKIEPSTHVMVDYIPVSDDRVAIVMQTQESDNAPYCYDHRPYLRIQSTTSKMSQTQLEGMFAKRGNHKYLWEDQITADYKIEDLDQEEIREAIQQGINTKLLSPSTSSQTISDIFRRLKIMKGDKLTNAAAVLFAIDAREGYPQCHIRMARFRGITKQGAFMDSRSFYGNAFQILSEASTFIDRHLPVSSELPAARSFEPNSFVRVDTPALPVLAVREALINAIIHRDYSNRTSHIALAIYDDRLEIWSFGRLSAHLTIPELSESHYSHPRNKNIAEMFHIRGFVECWGTGTNKIIDNCRDAGLPLPEFSEIS